MVNFVAKLNVSSSAAKSNLKLRLNEMRLRLKQRMAEKTGAPFQTERNQYDLMDSGLVDSGSLSSKQASNCEETIVSLDMISIINKTFTDYSKTSSRTSTPIFHGRHSCNLIKSASSKQRVVKRTSKSGKRPMSAASSSGNTPVKSAKKSNISKLSISNYYQSQHQHHYRHTDLNYLSLNKNNNYNYEIDAKTATETDLFYNYNNVNSNGFQDFGALKVWYV